MVEGGLGVRNSFSCALLEKWLWCFLDKGEVWLRVVVNTKYGCSWGGWCFNELLGLYGVGLWNNIRKVWEVFSSHTRFEVG
jgi:hypothetical protein